MPKPAAVVQVIGDTLFIDGSPHKFCGHCGTVIGSNDYERRLQSNGAIKSKGKIVRDGKVSYEMRPYMISILRGWIDLGEELIYVDGWPTVKKLSRPIIIQKPACFACWNVQRRDGGWYDIKLCTKPNLEAFRHG